MFSYYYRIFKHFRELKALSKKCALHLIFSAILRTLSTFLLPFFAALIIDGLSDQNPSATILYLAGFAVSVVVLLLCREYNYWAYACSSRDIHNRLQIRILEKVSEFDLGFTADISKAELLATAFRDVDRIRQIPDYFIDCLTRIVGIVFYIIILIFVDYRIGLVAFGLFFLTLAQFIWRTKRRDFYLELQHEHSDELASLYSQVIEGYKEVQTLNLKEKLYEPFSKEQSLWHKYYQKQRLQRDAAAGFTPIVLGSGRIFIYLFTASLILNGEYNVSILVLALGYYEDIIKSFDLITETIDNISRTSVGLSRLRRLLSYQTPHMLKFGTNKTDNISGLVEFKNVSFKYGDHLPSIKHLSFSARPHEITTIVGKSGCGKSTILRLLLRLYKIKSGAILLDDISIYDYSKKVYSTNVSIVTQKPFVFDLTIRENLNLIDRNKKHQEAACRLVGVHEDIMKLEKGYDTPLVADGSNLSAGQKQLLALARTLLSRSEVLLFDEVTSALDPATTDRVIKVLKKLKKDHTIIMVTHKPELMTLSDHLLVLDRGRLVAEGSPKDLLKSSPLYRSLQTEGGQP